MISDYSKFFAKSQGAFRGEKRTYTEREGTIHDANKEGTTLVSTTVKEKFDYFIETTAPFIDALMAQENTNALGVSKAELIVEGQSWGEYPSLVLLRVRSLLESSDLGNLSQMLMSIPVRSDAEVWNRSQNENYKDREIYETEMFKGVAKTTIKKSAVLKDPNLQGRELPANYQAPVAQIDEILELGDYTKQNFSGEWSHRERAMCLRRRDILVTAITEALKVANDVEVVSSEMTGEKIFGYLFFNRK